MLAPTVPWQTNIINHTWTDREARIKAAFVESAIASTPTLTAVLATVFRHAPQSSAHAHRVASLARTIGRELHMDDHELDEVERAAWTHDLGKFVIPFEGAGSSEPEQWTEQLLVAAGIMGAVPFLAQAAQIVLASRECFDGSGYPFGLAGDGIPLGARVIHVADAFDALVSVCVSLNVPREAAEDELVRHAGRRFDPDVVAACLRAVDALEPVFPAGEWQC